MKVISTEIRASRWNTVRNRLWRLYHEPRVRSGLFHFMVLAMILLGAISQILDG